MGWGGILPLLSGRRGKFWIIALMSQQPLLYLPRHPVGMKRHHHWHAKHRRQKGSPLSIAIIGVAIVIGSFGGVGSSRLPSSSSSPPIAEEDSRRPQGSVASQSYISAADVDDQQSSSPARRTDPERRLPLQLIADLPGPIAAAPKHKRMGLHLFMLDSQGMALIWIGTVMA